MGQLLILTLIILWISGSHGYGTGAPESPEICQTMLPGHGTENVPLLTTKPPYTITLSPAVPAVLGGDRINITLAVNESEDTDEEDTHFKGFFAMFKYSAFNDTENYGTFTSPSLDKQVKTVNCFQRPNSAVTHVSASEKTSVTFEWVAPNYDLNELKLFVTFVKEFSEIWHAVAHKQPISVRRNPTLQSDSVPQTLIVEIEP